MPPQGQVRRSCQTEELPNKEVLEPVEMVLAGFITTPPPPGVGQIAQSHVCRPGTRKLGSAASFVTHVQVLQDLMMPCSPWYHNVDWATEMWTTIITFMGLQNAGSPAFRQPVADGLSC